jgi:hypothetical protein
MGELCAWDPVSRCLAAGASEASQRHMPAGLGKLWELYAPVVLNGGHGQHKQQGLDEVRPCGVHASPVTRFLGGAGYCGHG